MMEFQKRDIFTRRERDGRKAVFIHEDWLVNNIKGLTERNLRVRYRGMFLATVSTKRQKAQSILPDTGASWRYAKKRDGFYYDYDRLPKNRQDKLLQKEALLALYEASLQANEVDSMGKTIDRYVQDLTPWLKGYADCTDIQAEHLARACAVIQFAADEISRREPTRCNAYYRRLAEVIKERSWVYLPKNYRILKRKIMEVVNGVAVTEVVKLPRRGNENSKKYDDKQVLGWMMYLRARPENYSTAHIARRIIRMCKIARKPVPSFSWLEHFFANQKTKFLTGAARHRSNRKGWEYQDYVPVAGALYAGDCWQMDGTRINFIPHKSSDGKERSMMIIAVRDVHSGDIIGFHLDTKEDRYGYLHALNMAVKNTGHLPYELVTDRFPGHNTDEWQLVTKRMEREGVKVTVTSTGTGKSHVERCFSTIQDVFMQDFYMYYGQGIQSSTERGRRSPEYLKTAKRRAKKEGWGFDEAWRTVAAVVNNYRTTPLNEYSTKNATVTESPKQLYEISETPNTKKVDEWTRVELFGTMRSQTIRNNGLIRMRIHKAEYVYRIEDYEIISNYKKVNVYYDLEDLSTIYLFTPDTDVNSKFLCEVEEEQAVQYYGPDADMERLAKMKKARKEIREQRKAELDAVTFGAEAEVTLLLGAVSDKVDADDAETAWLAERADIWQDRGSERRLDVPVVEDVLEDEDEGDMELVVVRNY